MLPITFHNLAARTVRSILTVLRVLAVLTLLTSAVAVRSAAQEPASNLPETTSSGTAVESQPTATVPTTPTPIISLIAQRREPGAPRLLEAPSPDSFVFDVSLERLTTLQDTSGTSTTIATTVFQRVRTRDGFDSAARGDRLGSPIGFFTTPTPSLGPGQDFALTTVRIPVGEPSETCRGCVNVTDGVYPVAIELRGANDDTLDQFVTFIRASNTSKTATESQARQLQVGLLVPLQSTPTIQSAQDIAPVQAARSLISMVEALASQRDVPLTIAAVPQSLDQLEPANADGEVEPFGLLDLLRSSLTGREVLSLPYVRLTNELLNEPTMGPFRKQLFALGSESLRERLRVEPITGTMISPEVVPADDVLDDTGISRLIVGSPAVERESDPIPVAKPIIVDPGARSGNTTAARPAIVLDDTVAQRFVKELSSRPAGSDDQLRVEHVIAELTLIEQLTRGATQRGVPVAVPVNTPQATLVGVLRELTNSEVLLPVRITALFENPAEQDESGAPILRTPTSAPYPLDPDGDRRRSDAIAQYTALHERNTGYASLFGPNPSNTKTRAEIASLQREAATVLAQDFTDTQRVAAIAELRQQFDALLERVANQSARRITLTARSQEIPLAFVNDTGRPITIAVIVETDNADLPSGTRDPNVPARQLLRLTVPIDGRVHQQLIPVSTKGPGRYSMLVRLQTPSGYEFSRTRYTLQATSIGAFGRWLTIIALVLLGLWWATTIMGKRREKSRTRAHLRHPTANESP
jgi:hypothetical protein